eukprot:23894_1
MFFISVLSVLLFVQLHLEATHLDALLDSALQETHPTSDDEIPEIRAMVDSVRPLGRDQTSIKSELAQKTAADAATALAMQLIQANPPPDGLVPTREEIHQLSQDIQRLSCGTVDKILSDRSPQQLRQLARAPAELVNVTMKAAHFVADKHNISLDMSKADVKMIDETFQKVRAVGDEVVPFTQRVQFHTDLDEANAQFHKKVKGYNQIVLVGIAFFIVCSGLVGYLWCSK